MAGPLLNLADYPALTELSPREGKMQISQSILSLFHNIAAPPTHLRTHVDTHMGFVVDGECVLERRNTSQLRPVEIMGMQGLGIPLDEVPAVKENQSRLEENCLRLYETSDRMPLVQVPCFIHHRLQGGSAGGVLPRGPDQQAGERHRQPTAAPARGARLQGANGQARRPHAAGRRGHQDEATHRKAAEVLTVITR